MTEIFLNRPLLAMLLLPLSIDAKGMEEASEVNIPADGIEDLPAAKEIWNVTETLKETAKKYGEQLTTARKSMESAATRIDNADTGKGAAGKAVSAAAGAVSGAGAVAKAVSAAAAGVVSGAGAVAKAANAATGAVSGAVAGAGSMNSGGGKHA